MTQKPRIAPRHPQVTYKGSLGSDGAAAGAGDGEGAAAAGGGGEGAAAAGGGGEGAARRPRGLHRCHHLQNTGLQPVHCWYVTGMMLCSDCIFSHIYTAVN